MLRVSTDQKARGLWERDCKMDKQLYPINILFYKFYTVQQLDPANSNSVISNSPLL